MTPTSPRPRRGRDPLPMPDGLTDVRVRFAPNGEIPYAAFFTRTILYTWLFARRYSGAFVLRLDDTDLDRQIPGALQSYPRGMRWLGLDWDEGPEVGGDFGPYTQSERLGLYHEAIRKLLDEGKAYHCYCDRERLAALSAGSRNGSARAYDGRCRDLSASERRAAQAAGRTPAVRLRVPDEGVIVSHDLIRGDIGIDAQRLSDYVICRPDGWPTYHLTVVVDDCLMRISHVIRGSEGLANMAPQAVMHTALGLPQPLYLHFPLVRTQGFSIGERFLPSGQALYLDELRAEGWLPDAIVNYYALLGHSYPGGKEIRSREELIRDFDYRNVSRKDFVEQSPEKLDWTNRRYLQRHGAAAEIEAVCTNAVVHAGLAPEGPAREVVRRALPVLRPRMARAADAVPMLRTAFGAPLPAPLPQDVRDLLLRCADALERGLPMAPVLREGAARARLDRGAAVLSAVTALTGEPHRMGPDELVTLLGSREAADRLRAAARAEDSRPEGNRTEVSHAEEATA